ncbi:MAG: LacI family DNA-binding transcriptional regulator [Kluyvera sp.]
MATIKDVAEKAGLSVTTVSRFLNNHPYISDDKREKILSAMKALDYEPSTAAQQMRGVKSQRIGVLISRITNPFFASLVDALESTARKNGYSVLIVQNHNSPGEEKNCLDLLKKKIIDGLILCAVESEPQVIEEYQKYGPILLCNAGSENSMLPAVRVDDRSATYHAIHYLIAKGYRHIAYSTGGGFQQKGHGSRRNSGFLTAMKEAGLTVNEEWLFRHQHTYQDGQSIAREILQMPQRPDAIFAGSDEVACGIISTLTANGLRVPENIAVVGFDNLPVAEMLNIPLTTVSQPIAALGKVSAEYLLALIHGQKYQYDAALLKPELVIRQSA